MLCEWLYSSWNQDPLWEDGFSRKCWWHSWRVCLWRNCRLAYWFVSVLLPCYSNSYGKRWIWSMLYLLRCLTCLSNLNVPLIFASCRNQSSSSRVTMESSLLSSRRQTLRCLTKEITLRKTMLNKWSTSILRLASIPKMFGNKASTQMMSFTGKWIPLLIANVVA